MFRFSASSYVELERNNLHQFALGHAMMLYKSNAVYTFIPKNGCSTMRLSVANNNGVINGLEHGHWIHSNNKTFKPSLGEAIKSDYKFVILRCPFRRLASVFLDKFVSKERAAWNYHTLRKREIDLDDFTFSDFVHSLKSPSILGSDFHWKPQHFFLLYEDYTHYFALEQFSGATRVLKQQIGLEVLDARPLTSHGTDKYQFLSNQDFSDVAAFDIAVLKRAGQCPDHSSLYTEELISIVRKLYAKDIALYAEKCDTNDLLFQSGTDSI